MKKSTILSLFLGMIFLLCIGLSAQSRTSILSEKDIRALNNEISGELAQDYIRHIAHYSRLQPSKSYHQATEWVAEQAKKFGLFKH